MKKKEVKLEAKTGLKFWDAFFTALGFQIIIGFLITMLIEVPGEVSTRPLKVITFIIILVIVFSFHKSKKLVLLDDSFVFNDNEILYSKIKFVVIKSNFVIINLKKNKDLSQISVAVQNAPDIEEFLKNRNIKFKK